MYGEAISNQYLSHVICLNQSAFTLFSLIRMHSIAPFCIGMVRLGALLIWYDPLGSRPIRTLYFKSDNKLVISTNQFILEHIHVTFEGN